MENNKASLTQEELDNLFGTLEEIPETQHVWVIKSKYGSVFGGRCFSFLQAQSALFKVQEDYPNIKLEIKQIR